MTKWFWAAHGALFTALGAQALPLMANPLPCSQTQIWFAPRQDSVDIKRTPGERVSFDKFDFGAMLRKEAAWKDAAEHVSILTIEVHTIEHFRNLAQVVDMTNRHRFGVAIAGNMVFTSGLCVQHGMEGMDAGHDYAREIVAAARKWKLAGGRLSTVIMDSPFYFGFYASKKECHYSIAESAHRAAATFRKLLEVYPGLAIMDAEGPGENTVAEWLYTYREWVDQFQRSAGHRIDAVGMDLHWTDVWHNGYDWVQAARSIADFLHVKGMSVGLYINADDNYIDANSWLAACRSHLEAAAHARLPLEFVYVASWAKFPDHNLPETDPTSFTSLVDAASVLFKRTYKGESP